MAIFDQYPDVQQEQNPSPEAQATISGRWNDWLAAPENRAALMQFGVNLMQPIGVGQTPFGHLGTALGSAAEAQTKNIAGQEAEEERAYKRKLESQKLGLEAEDVKSRRIQSKKSLFGPTPYQQETLKDKDIGMQLQALKAAAEAELQPNGPAHRALGEFVKQLQGEQTGAPGMAPTVPGLQEGGGYTIKTDPQTGRQYYVGPDGQPIGWVPSAGS